MESTVTVHERTPARRFPLGQFCITPGADRMLASAGQYPLEFFQRHATLEQGELCEEDYRENLRALDDDSRIFSAFLTRNGEKVWVITEADRSVTTILLPDEY